MGEVRRHAVPGEHGGGALVQPRRVPGYGARGKRAQRLWKLEVQKTSENRIIVAVNVLAAKF